MDSAVSRGESAASLVSGCCSMQEENSQASGTRRPTVKTPLSYWKREKADLLWKSSVRARRPGFLANPGSVTRHIASHGSQYSCKALSHQYQTQGDKDVIYSSHKWKRQVFPFCAAVTFCRAVKRDSTWTQEGGTWLRRKHASDARETSHIKINIEI